MNESGEHQELLLWLNDYVDSWKEDGNVSSFTKSEELAQEVESNIAAILREISDKTHWENEKFLDHLTSRNASLKQALENNVQLLEHRQLVVPAFWNTLHETYIAYDVAKTTIEFCGYATKQGKAVNEFQREANKGLLETAQNLLKVVLDRIQVIKKSLDEGGWIDKLLEGGLPDTGNAQLTADEVRELVDENFLEEWAGLVVESWGESVQGFSLLKPLKV